MNHLDTQRKHSIFDDVLGPIMSGPSSSHSAGCARIGKMTQLLYGREISHAEVVFEENGAYPETYIGQGSNFGFTGGLLRYQTDDPRMKDAVKKITRMICRRRLRIRKKCGIIKPDYLQERQQM